MTCNHYNWPFDCPCISACETEYETPDDFDPSFYDNAFERANYPKLWS